MSEFNPKAGSALLMVGMWCKQFLPDDGRQCSALRLSASVFLPPIGSPDD